MINKKLQKEKKVDLNKHKQEAPLRVPPRLEGVVKNVGIKKKKKQKKLT